MRFTNPIRDLGNDPFLVRYREHYYLTESWNQGIWIIKSLPDDVTDLARGLRIKVWSPPGTGPNAQSFWAPELHHVGDRWYVYYAATTADGRHANRRMFALRSVGDDPLGPYQDAGTVADATNLWAIDGTRFEARGRSYFVWSGWPRSGGPQQNLYIAEMTGPTTLAGARQLIGEPEYPWERVGLPINEGPQALVRDHAVFLTYSASDSRTDDYCYGMLTNRTGDFLDPTAWVKSTTPVFAKTADVYGPGHGNFFTSPDGTEDWMIYHSARSSGSGWDRVMNVQRFGWNPDGSPRFGEPMSPRRSQSLPSGQTICYRCVPCGSCD